jgi:sulfocyanin SoxE-like protein
MKILLLRAGLGATFALGVLALSGCAIDGSQEAAGQPTVRVNEKDFHISAPHRVPAGEVNLSVTNRGPDAHELIVVRKDARRLPVSSDGLNIDEDKTESDEVGVLEPADPGVRRLKLNLRPGTYVMFCNMSGHHRAGMRHTLVVR